MNNEIYFGKNSLRFLYYRYRDSAHFMLSITVLIIVICCLLIFGFIIPQIEKWFSIRSEVEATLSRTTVINDNIAYMNALNRAQLESDVQVVTAALPIEKNFGEILNAIGTSSFRSGVAFRDYSFQVGSVASSSGQTSSIVMQGLSAVKLTLVINGTVDQLRGFLREVQKTLPLSQVISVEGTSGAITVTLEFYQKNLPQVTLKDDQPIPRVIETNAVQINQLSGWRSTQGSVVSAPASDSTNGALPLF